MARTTKGRGGSTVADAPKPRKIAGINPDDVVVGPTAAPVIALTMEQLKELIGSARSGPAGALDPAIVDLLTAQAKNTDRLANEFKRVVRRSNDTHPNISVFTSDPRCDVCKAIAAGDDEIQHKDAKGRAIGQAHPKTPLKYDVFFCGGKQDPEALTPIEVELLNQFEGSKEARDGRWTAVLSRDGSRRRLTIAVPAKAYDDMISLPPFTQILAELLYGSDVADPTTALSRIAELERMVKDLTAQLSQRASGQ